MGLRPRNAGLALTLSFAATLLGCDRLEEGSARTDRAPGESNGPTRPQRPETEQPNAKRDAAVGGAAARPAPGPGAVNLPNGGSRSESKDGGYSKREPLDQLRDDDAGTPHAVERRLRVVPPLAQWDKNADRELSRSEFQSGLFEWWDADRSGEVDIFEFQRRANPWLNEEQVQPTFKRWDAEGDGRLSRAELVQGAARARIMERWDRNGDGRIDDDELTYVLYRGWDIDKDDAADIEDWQTW